MRAGTNWRPSKVVRVNRVLESSTRPLHAVTDAGPALVKYMGNRAGNDALIGELLAAELATEIGLHTPDFAVVSIPSIPTSDPLLTIDAGPAFFSRWEQAQSLSPNSSLLANLREPHHIPLLVTFDTWIRNKDRFADDFDGVNMNYDNILFQADKRKTRLLVIDHSHAFAETTLEDEINDEWISEENVYGLFNEFSPMLTRPAIRSAVSAICRLESDKIEAICRSVPAVWGMTPDLATRLSRCLVERAKLMERWLLGKLFAQMELDLEGKEA